jgi:hypothetical protein
MKNFFPLFLCIAAMLMVSCKKNYIIGGVPENSNAYDTILSYDVLKALPQYDTLIMLIDTAGLKDQVNKQGVTFFVPSNYSILNYLQQRTVFEQNSNPNAQFGLDSLIYYVVNNINGTRDSLLMYFVNQPLPNSALSANGLQYGTGLPGDTVDISYQYTKSYSSGYGVYTSTGAFTGTGTTIISSVPQIVTFTQLWGSVPPNTPISQISTTVGIQTIVKSSNIKTANGYIEALDNSHTLFFYGTNP